MQHTAELIGLGIAVFAATNIDDIFILLGFFSDQKINPRAIILGQLLGIGALYVASVIGSLVSLVLAPTYVGLLGLIPIAIGLRALTKMRKDADESAGLPVRASPYGNVMAVAAVTIANGGDNLSIYTALFASRPRYDIVVFGVIFVLMTLVWLVVSHWLTRHRTLGAPIRNYGHRVVPWVLIVLGVLIMHKAGTLSLLTGFTS